MLGRSWRFWSVVGGMAVIVAAGVVGVLVEILGYGVKAVKVAATSTAVAAVAASVVATDKGAKNLGAEAFAAVYVEKLAPLFREGKLNEAKACFGEIREEALSKGGSEANVVRAWLAAADDQKVSEDLRKASIDYMMQEYQWQGMARGRNVEPFVVVAARQWKAGRPEAALEYSSGLLTHLRAAEDSQGAIVLLLREMAGIESKEDAMRKARRTFAVALSEAFPAGELDIRVRKDVPQEAGVNPGERKQPTVAPDRGASYAAIARELFQSGALDEGFAYFKGILSKAKEADETTCQRFSEGVVNQIVGLVRVGLPRETAEQLIHLAASQTKPEWYANEWSALVGGVEPGERLAYYQRLLQSYGKNALLAAGGLLTDSPESTTIQDVIAGHCSIISMEIEASAPSRGLQHLIEELTRRKAEAQIQEVCEFFWRYFPTEPIGYQALIAWIRCQKGIGGEALIAEACQELSESYPTSPTGELARLALARTYIWRGQVVEGLLMAAQAMNKSQYDKSELGLSDLRALADGFVAKAKELDWEVDQADVLMGLGEQLYQAGEPLVASSIFWSVIEIKKLNFSDPRTGLPVDPPDTDATKPAQAGAEVEFWRALALLATAQKETAVKVMENLVESHPKFRHSGLIHLFLAKSYNTGGAVRRAWKHIEACPKSIRDTKEASELYGQLAAVAPEEYQRVQDEQKIEVIKKNLLDSPQAPDADRKLMELAELLARRRKYSEAALNYEAVFKQYESSSLCPEALYRAITIYRIHVPNTERAKQLIETLKKKYPESRYALMLGDQT